MTEGPEEPEERSPSHDYLEAWLGDAMYDAQLRAGGDVPVDPDDPEALAAARRFRDVLGRFASGVTVVTATRGGVPVGLTCQSFASVSLNPPLVLFIPARTSRAWPVIRRAGSFCVNVLAADQADLSNRMASKVEDKFAGVSWSPTPVTGSPLLHGTLAHVDCRIHAVHEAGDHDVVIGRVVDLGLPSPGPATDSGEEQPLLFFRGQYVTTRHHDTGEGQNA